MALRVQMVFAVAAALAVSVLLTPMMSSPANANCYGWLSSNSDNTVHTYQCMHNGSPPISAANSCRFTLAQGSRGDMMVGTTRFQSPRDAANFVCGCLHLTAPGHPRGALGQSPLSGGC